MANYLGLTNRVLENLRWDELDSSIFDDPPDPGPAVKRFVNQAKDEVCAKIGGKLAQKEFLLETNRPLDYADVSLVMQPSFGTNQVIAAGDVFRSWMVGAKLRFPTTPYDQTDPPTGDGPADSTWRRIVTVDATVLATLDAEFTSDASPSVSDWSIFKDEYDLDATVRVPQQFWVNNEPLALCMVDNLRDLEMVFPGDVTLGQPTDVAICRSRNSGGIWMARFWPAPDERYVVRYTAKFRLPDLSDATDSWDIEPELEHIIVDRAMVLALQSPIFNDPDLSATVRADIRERVFDWKNEYQPTDGGRRRRRRGPDETGGKPVPRRRGTGGMLL